MKTFKNTSHPLLTATLLVFLILGCATEGFSQDRTNSEKKSHYVIVNNGEVTDLSFYTQVLDNANFDPYRLIEGRRTIRFESGFTIELLSGNELFEKYGKRINHDIIQQWGDSREYPHVLSMTPEGKIIQKMEVQPAKMQGKGF